MERAPAATIFIAPRNIADDADDENESERALKSGRTSSKPADFLSRALNSLARKMSHHHADTTA
jgi:hypothetical protein